MAKLDHYPGAAWFDYDKPYQSCDRLADVLAFLLGLRAGQEER